MFHRVAALAESTLVGTAIDQTMLDALKEGFNLVATGYTSIVKIALPAALGVFAISFALRRGIGFFRSVAG